MMYWGNYGLGQGMGFGFGWIFMILFWGLVILGIVYIVQTVMRKSGKSANEETSLDILKKRYAKGDIDKEEFDKMKNHLTKS